MEKLYALHESADFDLVVVDTPPTRNALDFLEAPKRLTRFLDHRLYRVLMAPTRGVARAVNVAAQAFLRTVSKVVGGDVVRDAIAFFSAFDGMEAGFRDRAAATLELLSDEVTAFVLVAAPRGDVVEEASYFAAKLAEADIPVRALVVNRMHPRFSESSPGSLRARAETLAGTDLGGLYANLAEFAQVAAEEERPPGRAGRPGGAGAGGAGAVPAQRRARPRRPGRDRPVPVPRAATEGRGRLTLAAGSVDLQVGRVEQRLDGGFDGLGHRARCDRTRWCGAGGSGWGGRRPPTRRPGPRGRVGCPRSARPDRRSP